MSKKVSGGTIILITFLLTITMAILAIGLGSVRIPIPDILQTIFGTTAAKKEYSTIIFEIRMPRVLLAMIVGANIAISGAILQAVVGNPLADPGLTGVTSGAAAFVLLIMLVAPEYSNLIPIAAFVGGILAAFVVFTLAWNRNGVS